MISRMNLIWTDVCMGKHKMQMRRLMTQYGIEFQKLDLSNINNFRWMCMMQLPILILVTWLLLIYDRLGIERVHCTTTVCLEHDDQRVKNARRQSTSYVKPRRCIVRWLKIRGTKQRSMRVLYMVLGNFNVSLLFWLFIILLFVSEYFSEISFHLSEECLIQFWWNFTSILLKMWYLVHFIYIVII